MADLGLLSVGVCYALRDAGRALASLRTPPELVVRRLAADEVLRLSAERQEWFFPGAVQTSLARGDECFGGFLDGVLACSGWFATRPLLALGAVVGFSSDCVWEHRLFTRMEFRGRGLNAALKPVAFEHFASRGCTTLLNTVEWTNDASRRLHTRLGYRRTALLVRLGAGRVGRTILMGGREFGMYLQAPGS
jgi:GNAT superfamily N-acetyltransferase